MVVLVHVAHMWRVIQPETEVQALYDDFCCDTFGLVFGGAIVQSVCCDRVSILGAKVSLAHYWKSDAGLLSPISKVVFWMMR